MKTAKGGNILPPAPASTLSAKRNAICSWSQSYQDWMTKIPGVDRCPHGKENLVDVGNFEGNVFLKRNKRFVLWS